MHAVMTHPRASIEALMNNRVPNDVPLAVL